LRTILLDNLNKLKRDSSHKFNPQVVQNLYEFIFSAEQDITKNVSNKTID